MKILYLLWIISADHSSLGTRGVWFDNLISCEVTAMEVAADLDINLRKLSCVQSPVGGLSS